MRVTVISQSSRLRLLTRSHMNCLRLSGVPVAKLYCCPLSRVSSPILLLVHDRFVVSPVRLSNKRRDDRGHNESPNPMLTNR